MTTWKTRTCEDCQKQEWTASPSPVCLLCRKARERDKRIIEEREKILSTYGNVEGPINNAHNQRCYTFTHTCGTTQTWTFSNLLKQWKTKPGPCSKCGATERVKPAMQGYIDKYGLDEKLRSDLRAYTRRVRGLSEETYKKYKPIINPLGLKRGMKTFHLDHIVPIVECFRLGWSPKQAAALDNLQILKADDNLTKGRS